VGAPPPPVPGRWGHLRRVLAPHAGQEGAVGALWALAIGVSPPRPEVRPPNPLRLT